MTPQTLTEYFKTRIAPDFPQYHEIARGSNRNLLRILKKLAKKERKRRIRDWPLSNLKAQTKIIHSLGFSGNRMRESPEYIQLLHARLIIAENTENGKEGIRLTILCYELAIPSSEINAIAKTMNLQNPLLGIFAGIIDKVPNYPWLVSNSSSTLASRSQ